MLPLVGSQRLLEGLSHDVEHRRQRRRCLARLGAHYELENTENRLLLGLVGRPQVCREEEKRRDEGRQQECVDEI